MRRLESARRMRDRLDRYIQSLENKEIMSYIPKCKEFRLSFPPTIDDFMVWRRVLASWLVGGVRYGVKCGFRVDDPPDMAVLGMIFRDGILQGKWRLETGTIWHPGLNVTGMSVSDYEATSLDELMEE